MKKILALDFDGLIADSTKEGILVSWNGYYGKNLADFSEAGFASIPNTFVRHFAYCRNFARHLGQFLVPLLDSSLYVHNEETFDEMYRSISLEQVSTFIERVSLYRERVRQEKRAEWMQYHQLYPGMANFLSSLIHPTYIVTAKDPDSVIAILEQSGVSFPPNKVFGNLQGKTDALQEIARLEETGTGNIHLFDDNLYNIIQSLHCGVTATWALWGYHLPEHVTTASQYKIPAIELETFLNSGNASSFL